MFQRCCNESLNLRAGLGDGPSDDARYVGPSEEEYCRGLREAGFVFDGISAPAHCAAYFPDYRGMVPELFPGEIMVQAPTVTLNPIFDNFPRQSVREEIAYRAPEPEPVRTAPALAPILSPVAPSRLAPAPAPVAAPAPAAPTAGGGSSGGGMSATVLAPRDFAPPGMPAPVASDAGGGDFFGQVVDAVDDAQMPTRKSPVPLALLATLALTLFSR